MGYYNSLSDQQQSLIQRHLDLVIEYNKMTNLTRIQTREEALILHVEDSLTALPEMSEAPQGLYGDLGSGAGYPGIPLAIVTQRETMLIDAREKKMVIVDKILEKLEMGERVQTFSGRAELLARKRPESFAVLTARALAKLSVLMELASPLLQMNGRLICYKAFIDDDEYRQSKSVQRDVGMKLVNVREFLLDNQYKRSIVTFEKTKEPKIKLPRKEGEAQKKPLGE